MASIRLMYICESDINLIKEFSVYLDICQIIEQDKDINSLNSVSIGLTTYSYYTVICYSLCILFVHKQWYLHIMGINKCSTESGYPLFRYEAYCSNVMCEPKVCK